MTHTLTADDFWKRLDDVQSGMLSVDGARPVPMSQYADRDLDVLWFITAKGTDIVESLASGPKEARYVVAEGGANLYATVDGKASLSNDKAKLDELWNVVADSWFEGGEQDPDVQLVRVDLTEAEVWATTGKLGFLYEIAKAQVSEVKPDMGAHGMLRFAA
jgi:general stress protein 26